MDTKLQKVLKKANSEVKESGIIDPELKKIAFSKAIDFYLNEEDKSSQSGLVVPDKQNIPEKTDFWKSLTASTGVGERKLKDIYSIKDEQILLVTSTMPGESNPERRRNFSAIILLAYHNGLNHEWVSSKYLVESAKHTKMYDKSNFATTLKNSDWFRSKGEKRWLEYKLSGPGLTQAKNLLKDLAK